MAPTLSTSTSNHDGSSSTSNSTTSDDLPPLLYHKPAFHLKIRYFLQLWFLKIFTSIGFYLLRAIKPNPPYLRPTFTKAYPSRPHLKHRFFIPQTKGNQQDDKPPLTSTSRKEDDDGPLLPLYINIHGGGFALCDAAFDDEFCATFAQAHTVAVISIEYDLTPRSRFPGPMNDIIAAVIEILHDASLPIDRSRVVLGGFSAGGNLALAAAQHASVRDRVQAVVSWYPVTDMTLAPVQKQASRPYRGEWDTDDLKDFGPIFNWAYFDEGQDMRDPRIGVKWCRREKLPLWVCVVGAEFDMLCAEARDMTTGWVREGKGLAKDGWEVDGGKTKWMLKRNVRHGFTHELMAGSGQENHRVSRKAYKEAAEEIADWLFRGAWKA